MKTRQAQIKEIIKWFDWGNVFRTMKALDWKWASSEHEETPLVGELVTFATQLLEEVEEDSYTSCGGFVARMDEKGYLSLSFEVSSWNSHVL